MFAVSEPRRLEASAPLLWWVSKPVDGIPDAERAVAMRSSGLARKAAAVSLVVHALLAVGLIASSAMR